MQVYVKKEDRHLPIPGTIAMLIFLIAPVVFFIHFWSEDDTLMGKIESYDYLVPFSIVFFMFGLWFLYFFLKKPTGYTVKLLTKEAQTYRGDSISYMRFETIPQQKKNNRPDVSTYLCYTFGENDLVVGNEYNLIIKEYTRQPKYVEAINSNIKTKKDPGTTLMPVFWAIEFIFGSVFIVALIGAFMNPDDIIGYILAGGINIVFMLVAYKMSKTWRADNSGGTEATNAGSSVNSVSASTTQGLSGVPFFHRQDKKLGESMTKYSAILLMVPILLAIISTFGYMGNPVGGKALLGVYAIAVVFEIVIIASVISKSKRRKKAIEKYNKNTQANVDLGKLHTFKIIRISPNDNYPDYVMVDDKDNLIFSTKITNPLTVRRAVVDPSGIQVCDIKMNSFSLANEQIIRIAERPPFSVRSKLGLGEESYIIAGRDYTVAESESEPSELVIRNGRKEDIAHISLITNNAGWAKVGDIKVNLNITNEDVMDIMMLALCVSIIKQRTFDWEVDNEH